MSCCKRTGSPTDVEKGTMLVQDSHLPIIWIFGGPCSGKTTVCQRITEKYQFMHIDCDTVLRFEAMTQSSRGLQISSKLNRRERIPDDILVKILREIMPRNVKLTNGYLLDNFPSNAEQAKLFEKKICNVTAVLYMKVSSKTMAKRFVSRRGTEDNLETTATSSTVYRMPTLQEIALRSDRIEVQIKEFEGVKSNVLNQYADALHVLNAEKNADNVFRTVDTIIAQICKKANVPLPEELYNLNDEKEKEASPTSSRRASKVKSAVFSDETASREDSTHSRPKSGDKEVTSAKSDHSAKAPSPESDSVEPESSSSGKKPKKKKKMKKKKKKIKPPAPNNEPTPPEESPSNTVW